LIHWEEARVDQSSNQQQVDAMWWAGTSRGWQHPLSAFLLLSFSPVILFLFYIPVFFFINFTFKRNNLMEREIKIEVITFLGIQKPYEHSL
jgi:hypothetical protein